MAGIFAFTCACCGERHEGSPSFGYRAPDPYDALTEDEKRGIATLDDDLCTIARPDRTDRFARVVLELPIHGVDDPFLWGVWVSLSEASFDRYVDTWSAHDEADRWFGWFCNRLPFYPDTRGLKSFARPRNGGARPRLELEDTDHPLAVHFHRGLRLDEAQEIAEVAMHGRRRHQEPTA